MRGEDDASKRVLEALRQDGVEAARARAAVQRVLAQTGPRDWDALTLYRKAVRELGRSTGAGTRDITKDDPFEPVPTRRKPQPRGGTRRDTPAAKREKP